MPIGTILKQQTIVTDSIADDKVPAIFVYYTGTGAATLAYDGSNYTFQVDTSNDVSVNTGGAAGGLIANGEAATYGGLVDLINLDTDKDWRAWIVGGYRDLNNQLTKVFSATPVTKAGITSIAGVSANCMTQDTGTAATTAPKSVIIGVFGPELDDDLDGNMRICVPIRHITNAGVLHEGWRIDPASDLYGLDPIGVPHTRAFVQKITVTAGQASPDTITVRVRSVGVNDEDSDAEVLYEKALTNDTESVIDFGMPGEEGPVELIGGAGRRLIVDVTASTASFDVVAAEVIGGYGVGGGTAQLVT
jgi:hypothetical protein